MLSTLASDHRRLSSPIATLEMETSSPAMSSLRSSSPVPRVRSPMRTLTMFSRVSSRSLLLPTKRREWLSDLHVFMGLLMSVVGAGMLSVPYTFVTIPASQAVAGIVGVGISMGCTATALLHAHVQVASKEEQLRYAGAGRRFASFQALSGKAGGEIFALVVSVVTALGIFGGCVGGIRIVRDLTPHIAELLLESSSTSSSDKQQTVEALLLWGSFVVVVLPLCLLKNLSALKITNYLGFVFSIYLVIAVAYRSLQALPSGDADSESGSINVSNLIHLSFNTSLHDEASTVMPFDAEANAGAVTVATSSSPSDTDADSAPRRAPFLLFAQSISIYNFAFMMHLNLLPLFVQLRGSFDRSMRQARNRMTMGIASASGFCIALYLVLGVCGAKLYGKSINGNMLLNLATDPTMQIPLVALYVIVIVTFPLLFHPMRRILEELLVAKSSTPICFLRRVMLTVVLLGSALLIAMQVPGIEVVFSLLGATTCMLICFVFPVIIFTRVCPWRQRAWTKLCTLVLWLIVAFEVVIGVAAVYSLSKRKH